MSTSPVTSRLPKLLLALEPDPRALLLQAVVSFRPQNNLETEMRVGPIRAAFAEYWENKEGCAVPIAELRSILSSPVPVETILEFHQIKLANNEANAFLFLNKLIQYLKAAIRRTRPCPQMFLFEERARCPAAKTPERVGGDVTHSLGKLVRDGRKFPTIYADPPWQYANTSSRAAAENHYPTMPLKEICAEPVAELAEENAHLHLWTTNGFLQDAFKVMDAWGFTFKSSLVWVKDEIGMGN